MKCHFDSRRKLILCTAMQRFARPMFDGYIGVFYVVVTTLSTGKERCIGLKMQNGRKDNGVMLNCCPFCKGNIQGWDKKKVAKNNKLYKVIAS